MIGSSVYEKKITLYVESVKKIEGTQEFQSSLGGTGVAGYSTIGIDARAYKAGRAKYQYVLTDEQESIVSEVRNLCDTYGFTLDIVDVTQESVLRRLAHEKIKGIDVFPALVSESGRWIEGITSKEQAKAFLSREIEPLL